MSYVFDFLFLQDFACAHSANTTKKCFVDCITVRHWPGNWPALTWTHLVGIVKKNKDPIR